MNPARRSHEFTCESCLNCVVCGIAMREALSDGGDRPCQRNAAHRHPTPQEIVDPYVPDWAVPLAAWRPDAG